MIWMKRSWCLCTTEVSEDHPTFLYPEADEKNRSTEEGPWGRFSKERNRVEMYIFPRRVARGMLARKIESLSKWLSVLSIHELAHWAGNCSHWVLWTTADGKYSDEVWDEFISGVVEEESEEQGK